MNAFRLFSSLLVASLLLTQPATAQSTNFFAGPGAGAKNTTGTGNTFVGASAGASNKIGNDNVFMGPFAGLDNTSGSVNAFIGRSAGHKNTTGSSNVFLGNGAGFFNTTGMENTFVGRGNGGYNSTGNGNSYFGFSAGSFSSQANLTNATAIGHRALVSRSNALVLGSIKNKNGATSDVNVGIGIDAPTFQLHLSKNSAAKPGSSSWTVASDERLKKNVEAFTDGLAVLLQVKPVKYRYNGKAEMPTEKEYVGVIAKEMQQVAPYMVGEFLHQDTTGKEEKYLNYDASALTYILVNSVKELKNENEVLRQENVSLQNKLIDLEKKFVQLERQFEGAVQPGKGSVARLWQNAPNPYDRTTVIKYFIPHTAGSAAIQVFNSSAQQVSNYILNTGEGEVTLSTGELAAGTYVYALFVDGAKVESKKLVVLR